MQLKHFFKLLLLTGLTVLVQGYHMGADDGAIYIPAVKRAFHPQLYPFGAEFFMEHERLSIFGTLVASSARLLHLSIDLVIFLWYIFGIFLLLAAAWRIACLCFSSSYARWGSVLLLAALLTVPVAGTALVIADPYLSARSLSTPATLWAIDSFLRRRPVAVFLWIVAVALIHPQMAVIAIGFLLFVWWFDISRDYSRTSSLASAAALPSRWPQGFNFHPVTEPYKEVLYSRTFFFASLWEWYEWLGAVLPLVILYAFSRLHPRGTLPAFRSICRTLVPFGIFSTAVFILLSSNQHLISFVRLQPMRSFHVLYMLFYILLGGLIGEYALKSHVWRWLALFAPLAIGMFVMNQSMYASSRHIELPNGHEKNPWVSAFFWVRENTPTDAVFALDPDYFWVSGEDRHGFRAIAERSALADAIKDSGAVSLFPQLASDWEAQQKAQAGWKHFQAADFSRLAQQYPITWVIVQIPEPAGLSCPYRNSTVAVCRIPH